MNKLHLSALLCFIIAILLYLFGSSISIIFGAFGIFFEIAAYVYWARADSKNMTEGMTDNDNN